MMLIIYIFMRNYIDLRKERSFLAQTRENSLITRRRQRRPPLMEIASIRHIIPVLIPFFFSFPQCFLAP